jgi:hypothetical protein
MRCGDLFNDADVFNLDDWRPGGPASVVPNDDDGEGIDACK